MPRQKVGRKAFPGVQVHVMADMFAQDVRLHIDRVARTPGAQCGIAQGCRYDRDPEGIPFRGDQRQADAVNGDGALKAPGSGILRPAR